METVHYIALIKGTDGHILRSYETTDISHFVSELIYLKAIGLTPVVEHVYSTDTAQ